MEILEAEISNDLIEILSESCLCRLCAKSSDECKNILKEENQEFNRKFEDIFKMQVRFYIPFFH